MGLPAIAGGIGAAVRIGASAYEMYSRTRTRQKRKRNVEITGGNAATVSREYKRTGRRRSLSNRALNNRIIKTGTEFVYRWQNTSATYLGPGRLKIGWTVDGPNQFMPIHFMSLSQLPSTLAQNFWAKGCFHHGMAALYYDVVNGECRWTHIPSETSVGNTSLDLAGNWQLEKSGGPASIYMDRFYHKWTDIKLNLYGTYSVPITYNVWLCTMPEQIDPYSVVQGQVMSSGSELNSMFRDMLRTRVHSSVGQNAAAKWPKDMRVIKKMSVTINPLSYSDQQAEAESSFSSNAPHIHELRWFVRHERFRDYKWSKDLITPADKDLTNGGWDVDEAIAPMSDCEWGKKLYLFVTATSPQMNPKDAGVNWYNPGPNDPKTQGSYDVSIRNCFVAYGNI